MVVLLSSGLYRPGKYEAGFGSAFRSGADADIAKKLPNAGGHNSSREPTNMNLSHFQQKTGLPRNRDSPLLKRINQLTNCTHADTAWCPQIR
jgi:hypothetical protein